jgi:mannosyltransferase
MASTVASGRAGPRLPRVDLRAGLLLAAIAALVGLSLLVRTRAITTGFWIDEGLSVGISSHGLFDIPGVLRQDGSPPLYYMLLHVWMRAFGGTEQATHALSLLFAVLTVPAGAWAGWTLLGRRAALFTAIVCALNPFLTLYAQETRMYSLVILLSLVGTAALVHGFLLRDRRYLPVFAVALALLLWTHNWGIFLGLASVAALVWIWRMTDDRRPLVRDALLVYGAVGLAWLPWLPTLVYQALHTGAPWASVPPPEAMLNGLVALIGGERPGIALLLGAGAGVGAALWPRKEEEDDPRRQIVIAVGVVALSTLVAAWLFSQLSPAWANRYLAVVLGPLLLLLGLGLARTGRLGIAALVLVVVLWFPATGALNKSNVRTVSEQAHDIARPGDLVISTHPEQVPVLHYYLPAGLRYATPLGPVRDTGVMDWRDAQERLDASSPGRTLKPLLANLRPGRRLLLVRPIIGRGEWKAPWTRLVRGKSAQWERIVSRDPRFERRARIPAAYGTHRPRGVRVTVYTKTSK